MICVVYIILFVLKCVYAEGGDPPGHMKPLGSHRDPIPVEVRDFSLGPVEFFNEFVKPGKPVLLRGAAKRFPSFDTWKNDEDLKRKYGDWEITAEVEKKEKRKKPTVPMSFKKFLNIYNKSDIYLIQDIFPDNPMSGDIFIPKCLLCGGFTDVIVTAVMWFSSGGTKSVLHNDDLQNINCLYDGQKELILMNKNLDVGIDNKIGTFSSVDVDSVDMYKYPTLSQVPWYKATMEAGDCFYIPYKWHHQVNSLNTRNLAINLWFGYLYTLNKTDSCFDDMKNLPNYDKWSNYKVASEVNQMRCHIHEILGRGSGRFSYNDLIEFFEAEGAYFLLSEFFEKTDLNSDGLISSEEVDSITDEMIQLYILDKEEDTEDEENIEKSAPPGHLQPLGSHTSPSLVEVTHDWPDPVTFFNDYVKPGKPVLFRGLAKSFPSFINWQSDEYQKNKYGKWDIEAEEGKKEDRDKATYDMKYETFLEKYNESDIYLVQDILPSNPMSAEVFLPKSLLCGDFTDHLGAVVMWFSSGGTKSVLHNDGFDNINCLFDGSKELILIDRKHRDLIPIDRKGGYSSVDVDSVDMHKYPTLSQVPWYKATMEAGDCFYIPYKWYHHVNSSLTRNLAINTWWYHLPDLPNKDSCHGNLPDYDSLSNYKFCSSVGMWRGELFEMFDDKQTVSYEDFKEFMDVEPTQEDKVTRELFSDLDSNDDRVLTFYEIYKISHEKLEFLSENFKKELFEADEDNVASQGKDEL